MVSFPFLHHLKNKAFLSGYRGEITTTFSLVEVFLCLGNTGNLDVYNNIWHGAL